MDFHGRSGYTIAARYHAQPSHLTYLARVHFLGGGQQVGWEVEVGAVAECHQRCTAPHNATRYLPAG